MRDHIHRPLLSAALFLAVACAHAPEPAEASASLAQGSLESGGRARTFRYFVPESGGEKRPLVIGLHGRMGDGQGQDKLGGMSKVAAQEGFLLALPDGYSRSWHDAREHGPAADAQVDDVAFLSALIDWFVQEQNADPARVYVMGMSNGGFMALTLACRLANKVAAAASVTGAAAENLKDACTPARPISVALFMGDEYPLVPYEGGDVARNGGRALSARASAELFAGQDGCGAEPSVELLADADPNDGTRIERAIWSGCKASAEVRLYTVKGGGHTWPGGKGYLPEGFIGVTSKDLSATQEAWEFFKRYELE